MRTFNRVSLPDSIYYKGEVYMRDPERTDNFKNTRLSFSHSIVVKVLSKNLKGKTDFHGKPYQPTEWIYTSTKVLRAN